MHTLSLFFHFSLCLFVNQKKKQIIFTFRLDALFIKSIHVSNITYVDIYIYIHIIYNI